MLLYALAYAKVNLYLKVLGKRDDGLHDLDMVMQSVSLADKVSVDTDCDGIRVACDGIADDDNIVTAAAKAYFRRAEIADGRAAFIIEKNIPVLAGLGGGSTDAAAYLRRSGADPVVVRHLFRSDYETTVALARAEAHSVLYAGGLIVTSIPGPLANAQVIAAQTADSLLRIEAFIADSKNA